MGRSGNSKGYKVFSISTTVRNPYRNEGFLNCVNDTANELGIILLNSNELLINDENLNKIYFNLISSGLYQPTKVEKIIKDKWKLDIKLLPEEVEKIIKDNLQKTDKNGGGANRTKTQLRALKDQNLLMLDTKTNKLKLTSIGKSLIEKNINDNDLYIKAFITLQYGGILRGSALNKAMPFLNILNIINKYRDVKNKKLSKYQFGLILAMKDCNFEKTFKEIVEIEGMRELDQKNYLIQKISSENYVPINFVSFEKDYVDEVYRKIGRTGLFEINAQKYIGINKSEIIKVKLLINQNENYSFKEYENILNYYFDVENYKLPWETNVETRKEVFETKALLYKIDTAKTLNLDNLEKEIMKVENKIYFEKFAKEINIDYCYEYIIKIIDSNFIVSEKPGVLIDKTIFDYIKDYVKLEWLFSIILFKTSKDFVVKPGSNFDQYGYPKSQASGGKADIEIYNEKLYGTFELTMMKNGKQQLNSETTGIARHLVENLTDDKLGFSLLLAPIIHSDVLSYMNYLVSQEGNEKVTITGTPIPRFLNWMKANSKNKIKIETLFNLAREEFQDINDMKISDIANVISHKNLEKFHK